MPLVLSATAGADMWPASTLDTSAAGSAATSLALALTEASSPDSRTAAEGRRDSRAATAANAASLGTKNVMPLLLAGRLALCCAYSSAAVAQAG